MNKIELKDRLRALIEEKYKTHSCKPLIYAETLLEEYLKKYPFDTEMWLILAIVLNTSPLVDCIKAIECCKKVLSYDSNNVYAAVLMALIMKHELEITEECYDTLCTIKTEDKEDQALLTLAKAWYFEQHNMDKEYWEYLDKGYILWAEHVREFFTKYSCDMRDESLSERARANLQVLCDDYPQDPYDRISIEQLFNEYIRRKP